jgi:hypothetical protein
MFLVLHIRCSAAGLILTFVSVITNNNFKDFPNIKKTKATQEEKRNNETRGQTGIHPPPPPRWYYIDLRMYLVSSIEVKIYNCSLARDLELTCSTQG